MISVLPLISCFSKAACKDLTKGEVFVQKKRSVLNQMLMVLVGLTALMFAILSVFCISFYDATKQSFEDSANSILQVYTADLKARIGKMNSSLLTLSSQNEFLAAMSSNDESQRTLGAVSLQRFMTNSVLQEKSGIAYIVYDKDSGICLDGMGQGVSHHEKMLLRDYAQQLMAEQTGNNSKWNFVQIGEVSYLYRVLLWNNQLIAVFTKLSTMFEELPAKNGGSFLLVLTDAQGNISQMQGEAKDADIDSTTINDLRKTHYFYAQSEIVAEQLWLYVFPQTSALQNGINYGLFAAGTLVITAIVLLLCIVHFMRRKIAMPLQHIVNDMELIGAGALEKRIDDSFSSKEFSVLKDTTNQMLDEIMHLKISAYEKQITMQDLALKSIRLQLKPHFFLNALTTISSLSAQEKNESVATYIRALSKNVRYMFRAGLHTVPLRDELLHVQNYFEMQELKYPGCVLYFVDMPPELSEWPVPQMLIHTFVENEYKYAASLEEVLTILIKVRTLQRENDKVLLIEIEDDGVGYPQDVLAYMSGAQPNAGKGERVGLWSVKQMLELMYEQQDLLEITNVEPHGCLNKIYVPRIPVHELNEETKR